MAAFWWWGCVNGCDSWVNHQRKKYSVCCYRCCASQERIKVSAVPTAPWVSSSFPARLADPEFSKQGINLKMYYQNFCDCTWSNRALVICRLPWIMYSKGEMIVYRLRGTFQVCYFNQLYRFIFSCRD